MPPAPAPFPQKQLHNDYMSNMVTEHQPLANGMHSNFQPDILTSHGELPSNRGSNTHPFNHLNINGVTGINGHNVSQFDNRESANYNSNSIVLFSRSDNALRSPTNLNLHTNNYNPTQTIGEYDSNDPNHNVIYTSQAAAYPYMLLDGPDGNINIEMSPTSFDNTYNR